MLLLLVEIMQAGIGIAQYQLGLPICGALHLLGASVLRPPTVLSVSRWSKAVRPPSDKDTQDADDDHADPEQE